VWLQVVSQGLRSGMASRLRDALKAALDLLSEISEQELISNSSGGLASVMGAIANDDPNAALMLLNDQAWTQFTRLGIAQRPIDLPEIYSQIYSSPKQTKAELSTKAQKSYQTLNLNVASHSIHCTICDFPVLHAFGKLATLLRR